MSTPNDGGPALPLSDMERMNLVIPSDELHMAEAEYHEAVNALARAKAIDIDRFGYGLQHLNMRLDRVARSKAKMEQLSFRDYRQANPYNT